MAIMLLPLVSAGKIFKLGFFSPTATCHAMGGLFSEKFDVYSFSVLLLEIVSGRKNSRFYCSLRNLMSTASACCYWRLSVVRKTADFMTMMRISIF
ncbi:hypothetical protein RDI58_006780 [Solanum bulbocastanum]|uniref:Serine-threonine/tyrosine-protein kinase catalytic domain-containing protein n=1 Tax=Solanum bulbocastanum TaxID=147425 RepID=A0AAN8TYQ9_SOLBU